MTDLMQDLHKFLQLLDCESRKRKYLFGEGDLPPAKRQKLMPWVSKRFIERCREYHERKRKILIGLTLYWEAKVRDARRVARKRLSSEMYSEYEGFLMPKYPKLVLEQPIELQQQVTSEAKEAVELEEAIRSAVEEAVETEAVEVAKTSAVKAVEAAVEAVGIEAVEAARVFVEEEAAEVAAVVATVEAVEIEAVEATRAFVEEKAAEEASVEEVEIEAVQVARAFVEEVAKLEAEVKDEMSAPPQKCRLIKRLPENVEKKDVTEAKEVIVTRRKRWRRKGEKRS